MPPPEAGRAGSRACSGPGGSGLTGIGVDMDKKEEERDSMCAKGLALRVEGAKARFS